jgi:hypothetical protein
LNATLSPARPLDFDAVGIPEMADMAGVSNAAVNTWRFRPAGDKPLLPEPDFYIGTIPVWRLERYVEWAEVTGRPLDVDMWRAKRDAGGYRRPPHKMNTNRTS